MGLFSNSKHSKRSKNDIDLSEQEVEVLYKPFIGNHQHSPHALTPEEVIGKAELPLKKTEDISMSGATPAVSPLDALREKMTTNRRQEIKKQEIKQSTAKTVNPAKNIRPTQSENSSSTLLDKCMPYILDGGIPLEEKQPDYTLESFESIINLSSDKADKLLNMLNNLGSVEYDDLKGNKVSRPEPVTEKIPNIPTEEIKMESQSVFETRAMPKISDIDNDADSISQTASFDSISHTHPFEDISSGTKIIDLSQEIFEDEKTTNIINTDIFENPITEYSVQDDYHSFEDAKRIGAKILTNCRSSKLRLFATAFFTAVLALAKIPSIYDLLHPNPAFFGIISTAIFAVICIINFDVFSTIKSLFTPQKAPEALGGITAIATAIYSSVAIIKALNPYNVILFTCIILFFKCIAVNMRNKTILGNFKIIASRNIKYGIKFIDDRHITFAMAKNSVEGDIMLGLDTPSVNITDFIKNTTCDKVMCSKIGAFTVFAIITSAVFALFGGVYHHSFADALMFFATILGFFFSPTVFFTDILPLRRTSKKLNRMGAMITGVESARKLEIANAVALTGTDIFPTGTVTLYNMQVLDPNRIDDTILDAAAVTKQINSPLHSIFDNIAATQEKKSPVADTVKYEEHLGVSGWVDNRHIFIGNRTLLEAHGIKTPEIEVDRKILRNGYFPVYIACDDKPCALLMVQYNVKASLAFELQKLCSTGVTILIDTCDPNITNQMVSDYFGLAEESVYVMGSSGSHLYKNATEEEESFSCVAAHKTKGEALITIFNCAAKIKRAVTSLSIYHFIASIVMVAVFMYSAYLSEVSPINSGLIYLYTALSCIIAYIVYLFNKP